MNRDGHIEKLFDDAKFKSWSDEELKSCGNRYEVRGSMAGQAQWIQNAMQKL
jgi:hypothetical protein